MVCLLDLNQVVIQMLGAKANTGVLVQPQQWVVLIAATAILDEFGIAVPDVLLTKVALGNRSAFVSVHCNWLEHLRASFPAKKTASKCLATVVGIGTGAAFGSEVELFQARLIEYTIRDHFAEWTNPAR